MQLFGERWGKLAADAQDGLEALNRVLSLSSPHKSCLL